LPRITGTGKNMRWHGRMALFLALVVVARTQLVLDDIVEEQEQAPMVRGEGRGADGITDPTTKLLQWSVDNMDHSAVAERAKAIREGRYAEAVRLSPALTAQQPTRNARLTPLPSGLIA